MRPNIFGYLATCLVVLSVYCLTNTDDSHIDLWALIVRPPQYITDFIVSYRESIASLLIIVLVISLGRVVSDNMYQLTWNVLNLSIAGI